MEGLNLGGFLFGNINEEGVLEDDYLDEELRSALTNVTRKSNSGIGLNLDLSLVGIFKEEMQPTKASLSEHEKDINADFGLIDSAAPKSQPPKPAIVHTLSPRDPQNDAQLLSGRQDSSYDVNGSLPVVPTSTSTSTYDSASFHLTRDGRILRFTSFFAGRPVHGKGRYQMRRLRIKRKKISSRPILFQEDQADLFSKATPSNISVASTKAKSTLYHKILNIVAGSSKKRPSPRLKALEESFESRRSPEIAFVSHPEALQVVPREEHLYHPFELIEWESFIILEDNYKPPSKSILAPLYAGPFVPPQNSSSNSRIPSHMSSRSATPISIPKFHRSHHTIGSRPTSPSTSGIFATSTAAPKSLAGRILNVEFLSGKWEQQIIWDGVKVSEAMPPTNLQLNLNDPSLIFEAVDMASLTEKLLETEKLIQKRLKKLRHGTTSDGKSLVVSKFDRPVDDRFNLSNDKHYEAVLKEPGSTSNAAGGKPGSASRVMVSSRIGVQHSIPALKLALPFYKTFWTKNELRAWHRPKLDVNVLINRAISFGRLAKKKATPARKSTTGIIGNPKKLSLREDCSDFVLLEYAEEFPLLMMNVGMATFILHFYRKKHVKDTPTVDIDFGVPRILEPNESSPFWLFGEVRPGETISALQNNLFRAPIFEHQSAESDFLILKYNLKGMSDSHWFIRELPKKIFTVGQVFPTVEVFGPHSRKHNIFCRNRIQAFAYRLFRKDGKSSGPLLSSSSSTPDNLPRLKISRVMAACPQFSEGSLRKWLKDYADSVRSGNDSGTWRMRKDAPNLNEDDLRALVTPEMVCQYESMLAGQQRLNDAGFMDSPEIQGEGDDIIDNESAEIRLAPWNLSANFINATMGKCTLQLRGLGDPTGRGEGFSFVKIPQKMAVGSKLSTIPETSQKEFPINIPAISPSGSLQALAESTAQSQNCIKKPPKLSADQVVYRQEIVKIWDAQLSALRNSIPSDDEATVIQQFPMFEEAPARKTDDDTTSMKSSASKSSTSKATGRRLVIKRITRDPDTGNNTEQIETIDDPRLLSAYINQRRVWERKRRRRQIAAAASAARAKKSRPDGGSQKMARERNNNPSKPKKEVFVKCGTCGEIGHMRTNRVCPRYAEYEHEVKQAEEEDQRRRQARENAGLRVDGSKISISKSLLESAASAPVPPIKFKLSTLNHTAPSKLPPLVINTNASAKTKSTTPPSVLHSFISKARKSKGRLELESLPLEKRTALVALSEKLCTVVGELMAMAESWPFHRPVSKNDYPHYYRIVTRPLDLGTIRARTKRHHYPRAQALLADIQLVRDNCILFNGPDHPFSATITQLYDVAAAQLSDPSVTKLEELTHGQEPTATSANDTFLSAAFTQTTESPFQASEIADVVVDDEPSIV